MRNSIVKAKLKRREPVVGVCLHLIDPSLHELVSLMGFDFIWMDMEHHGYTVQTASDLMRASRVGRTDIMARCAKGEYMRMGRMLEAGAHGIMYPRCQSPEEAAEVVKWSKFAPMGQRGFDGGNPDMPYCTMEVPDYVKKANDETWVLIQLEDPAAVDRAEEIAAVPGVDIIILGPADFSVLSGVPGQFGHEKVTNAIKKIAKAADKHGKVWGMPGGSVQRVKELMDMGARWSVIMADIIAVKNALEAAQRDLAPLGYTFDNQLTKAKSYMEKA
ncbi:MAG: aldolase/citrate lyase family protein [Planctomycetota bacterium]|nr:aldolase/citrate lyase family protein [Planctomycetota bacterium]